jgi:diacylglycerol kinase (ATP)
MKERFTLGDSFRCAGRGIGYALKTQRNMRLHVLALATVITLGWRWRLQAWEWAALALTAGMVLAAELFNTALEKTVDCYTSAVDPRAALIKDLAAGAVLVTALTAVAIAGVIFGPHVFKRL